MNNFLQLALNIATQTDNRYRHGAVLVKGGSVIAFAPNIRKNDPQLFERMYSTESHSTVREYCKNYCSVHAEARVVKLAGDKARGSVVYVARVDKNGNPMMSRPCENCYKTLTDAGVKTVVYTHDDRDFRRNRISGDRLAAA